MEKKHDNHSECRRQSNAQIIELLHLASPSEDKWTACPFAVGCNYASLALVRQQTAKHDPLAPSICQASAYPLPQRHHLGGGWADHELQGRHYNFCNVGIAEVLRSMWFMWRLLSIWDDLIVTYFQFISQAYYISSVADDPTRAAMWNMLQYNGYYGCGWCLHPGVFVDGKMKESYLKIYFAYFSFTVSPGQLWRRNVYYKFMSSFYT